MRTAAVEARGADTGDQALRAVSPGNGEAVVEVPAQVTLTFASELPQGVTVRVLPPGAESVASGSPEPQVDGAVVSAPVPDGGPGGYTVEYTVGGLTGETGFTVLAPGQAPPPAPGGTAAGALVSIVLAVALVAVAALTVRRWMTR